MSNVDGQVEPEHYEGQDEPQPKRWDFSLNRWPNRIVYSLLAGWVVSLATGGRYSGVNAIGLTVAVVLFVLTTAIIEVARRR